MGRTWAPFSVQDDICVFLGTAAALLKGGRGDTGMGRDAELATPRAPSKPHVPHGARRQRCLSRWH